LACALDAKRRAGLPDSGTWRYARQAVDQCLQDIKTMRNPDGSLSANYFSRPGATRDLGTTLSSTGHLFEFAAIATSDIELAEPWMESAAVRLCEVLEATRQVDLDCGGLYHALNGLRIYNQRRGGLPTSPPTPPTPHTIAMP
jgi:hypothetical protein